jgi:Asp-tRNA(Asn)/Glu-tRNA(Gln) amidotransferase C subunit
MNRFLFREISEKEKEEVKKQAKQIMDSFSEKISELKLETKDIIVSKDVCERDENNEKKDEDFDKRIMFENAPEKNKEFIIAEKGGWE